MNLTDAQQVLLQKIVDGKRAIHPDEYEDAKYLASIKLIDMDDIGWEVLVFPTNAGSNHESLRH